MTDTDLFQPPSHTIAPPVAFDPKAQIESLRQAIESKAGRIVSLLELVEGFCTLLGNIRSSQDVGVLQSELRAAAHALAFAVESMPVRAGAPEADVRREKVNAMGYPVAGTREDAPALPAGAPTVIRQGGQELG